jgi:hypothetical protein
MRPFCIEVDTARSPDGNNGQQMTTTNPELALLISAWANLPGAIKAGIVAMVKAAT